MQVVGWEGGPPSFFLYKAYSGLITRHTAKGLSMVRVYEPNKTEKEIDEILTQLYLLKNALSTEKKAKLEERVNKIRGLLLDAKESLSS
jgi:hypothetical protein